MPGLVSQSGVTVLDSPLGSKRVFDVVAFGADPTGTNDATSAIQAAIDAAQGGIVFFPTGTFKITSTLNLTVANSLGTELQGSGMFKTTIAGSGFSAGTYMIRLGYKWQRVSDMALSGAGSGIRCASGTALNHKDATIERVWFHNSGTVGCLVNSGDGTDQCDNVTIRRCEFDLPANGVWVDATNPQYLKILECEFSGLSAAGIRAQHGGPLLVRDTIFGACYKSIEIKATDNGLTAMYLDNIQGEANSSGYFIDIHGTCRQLTFNNVIFNNTTYLSTGNIYVMIACWMNDTTGVFEVDPTGVRWTEIGCLWQNTAVKFLTADRPIIQNLGGTGLLGDLDIVQFEELTLDPGSGSVGTGTLKTKGPTSSAQDQWKAYLNGTQRFGAGYDGFYDAFSLGAAAGVTFLLKSRTAASGTDVIVAQGDSAAASTRVSYALHAGNAGNVGPISEWQLTDSVCAVDVRHRNGGGGAIPTKFAFKYDSTEVFNYQSDGVHVTGVLAASGAVTGSNISGTHSGTSSGTNTGDVTLGTANGLSLASQALSLQAATGSVPGALSAADWTTFNGKQAAIAALSWTNVTYANSWVDFDTVFFGAAYTKDVTGRVHLRGRMKSGTVGATAFTLPVGSRPSKTISFPVVSNGLFGECRIASDGTVTPWAGSNTSFHVDGISFDAS